MLPRNKQAIDTFMLNFKRSQRAGAVGTLPPEYLAAIPALFEQLSVHLVGTARWIKARQGTIAAIRYLRTNAPASWQEVDPQIYIHIVSRL